MKHIRQFWLLCLLLLLTLTSWCLGAKQEIEGDEDDEFLENTAVASNKGVHTLNIEHALGNSEFSKRGTITINASTKALKSRERKKDDIVLNQQFRLTKKDLEQDLYRIRVQNGPNSYVMTTIRTCSLLSSNFHDQLILHLDDDGTLVGIDYVTSTQCDRVRDLGKEVVKDVTEADFHTNVIVEFGTEAPRPKVEPKPKANPQGENPEANQSFFAKYWYYFVPAFILIVLNNAMSALPEEGDANRQPNRQQRRRQQ